MTDNKPHDLNNNNNSMPPPPPRNVVTTHVTADRHHPRPQGGPPPPPSKRTRFAPEASLEENDMYYQDDEYSVNDNQRNLDKELSEEYFPDTQEEDDDNGDDTSNNSGDWRAEFHALVQMGMQAHAAAERLQQENTRFQHDKAAQVAEVSRLRAALQQKQDIIANLCQAVETTQSDTRQAARATAEEAKLRLALADVTVQKDEAQATVNVQQNQIRRLQDQNSATQAKLTRVTQEKMQLAREQRVALTMSRQVDTHAAADVEFYKAKVTELTGKVQALNTTVLDKTRENQDLIRQLEMSMSRHQVAKRRAAVAGGRRKPHHDDDIEFSFD